RARDTLRPAGATLLLDERAHIPHRVQETLDAVAGPVIQVARQIVHSRDVLFLGRKLNYPIALEGALKLKEIAYVHAEGYAAGELKHGPIALIDEKYACLCIVPRDDMYEKVLSNMQEMKARGGKIIAVCHEGDTQ